MAKKEVADFRSELLDSRFGSEAIRNISEGKIFPKDEMHFKSLAMNCFLMGMPVRTWPRFAKRGMTIMFIS